MRLHPRRKLFWTVLLPAMAVAAGVAAAVLFEMQGGFGRGHGRYDRAICYLGRPGILVIERLPSAYLYGFPDFGVIVVVPAVINVVCAAIAGRALDLAILIARHTVKSRAAT